MERPKRCKKTSTKGRLRKATWRKIDHSEIENVASSDLRDTIVDRLLKTDAAGLFSVDASGKAKLSRSIRRDIKRYANNTHHVSPYFLTSLAQCQKALPKREKSIEIIDNKRRAVQQVYDVWGSNPNAPTTCISKRPSKKTGPPIQAPAVCLPLPGQSVNPEPSQYRDTVLSAAAMVLEKDRKNEESQRKWNPVSSYLLDVLPQELVDRLDSLQKQKAYAYLLKLQQPGEERLNEAIRYIEDVVMKEVSDPVSDEDQEAEHDEEPYQSIRQPLKGKKSRAARNRFERHCLGLKEAAQRREKKKFLNRIDHIKEYIDALEESEERRKALKLYKRSVKEARETAQRSGISIRYKCGRYYFEDGPVDVVLPSTAEKTEGSLRRLRLSDVPAAAIKDRIASIYRRKLLEPTNARPVTPRVLARARRLAHWRQRARKTKVKIAN